MRERGRKHSHVFPLFTFECTLGTAVSPIHFRLEQETMENPRMNRSLNKNAKNGTGEWKRSLTKNGTRGMEPFFK